MTNPKRLYESVIGEQIERLILKDEKIRELESNHQEEVWIISSLLISHLVHLRLTPAAADRLPNDFESKKALNYLKKAFDSGFAMSQTFVEYFKVNQERASQEKASQEKASQEKANQEKANQEKVKINVFTTQDFGSPYKSRFEESIGGRVISLWLDNLI